MSSLLNNASLLLNPAGSIISYQEDKIYSVLPKDGTGDFTFSGGDGGTRVNQQGYIEKTPFNLFNYSNALNTSPWYMAVTGGQTGKDGAANAWLLTKAGASTSDYYNTKVLDGVQTVSFYVKKEASKGIKPYAIGGVTLFAIINIETGVVISKSAGVEVVVEEYSSTWWRIHVTANVIDSYWYWYVTDAAGTQIASTVTLQDMQLVNGAFIKPYQPTTDRLNYPRITYQNGRGALLSEPQRTNVTTNSQIISAFTGTTVSLDSGISPDGTQNADKLIEDTSTGIHITIFGGSLGGSVDSSTFCVSIFAKAAERTRFIIFDNGQAAGAAVNYFDLGNGTKISGNGTIENYGNGWYRCIIFPSKTDSTTANIQIRLINTGTNDSYTGDGSSGIFFWGKQIEAGTYPTSYIPTTSATVTRPADSTNNTNTTNVASVVGQTEGVLYSDLFFEANGAERNYMYLNTNNSYNNGFLYLIGTATNRLAVDIYNFPNTQQFSSQSPTLTTGRYKAAIAYKQNDFDFYLN